MTLNLAQVCQAKYPGEVEKLNITFQVSDFFAMRFHTWNVPGIPQPKEEDILAEADQYEQAYNKIIFIQNGDALVQERIDFTAQSRQYNNGVYCASYAQSTNPTWAAEATAFIAWRDDIFAYALEVYSDIQEGKPIPTQEEFVAGFPEIVWPS